MCASCTVLKIELHEISSLRERVKELHGRICVFQTEVSVLAIPALKGSWVAEDGRKSSENRKGHVSKQSSPISYLGEQLPLWVRYMGALAQRPRSAKAVVTSYARRTKPLCTV